ncbi:uncharacterized protein TNCV_3459141 [Trichonephila clavipes]|nr:uncharacterized protein TNCV_3459141 [Trichonephila clavipes]
MNTSKSILQVLTLITKPKDIKLLHGDQQFQKTEETAYLCENCIAFPRLGFATLRRKKSYTEIELKIISLAYIGARFLTMYWFHAYTDGSATGADGNAGALIYSRHFSCCYHTEPNFKQCGTDRVCYEGQCLSTNYTEKCKKVYGKDYLGIENPKETCCFTCVSPDECYKTYKEYISDGTKCLVDHSDEPGPMDTDSDAEIDNETPIKTVTFSEALHCLETLKTYLMHWKRVAVNSSLKELKGHVKEKTSEPVTTMHNQQIIYFWLLNNLRCAVEARPKVRWSINFCCRISKNRLVCPVSYEGTLTGFRYLSLATWEHNVTHDIHLF